MLGSRAVMQSGNTTRQEEPSAQPTSDAFEGTTPIREETVPTEETTPTEEPISEPPELEGSEPLDVTSLLVPCSLSKINNGPVLQQCVLEMWNCLKEGREMLDGTPADSGSREREC